MGGVNLLEIYIANGMGLMLMCGILIGNTFKMQNKIEATMLYFMAITLVICCIIDPIVFTLDGKSGMVVTLILYLGNFLLYIANLVFSPVFLVLMERKALGHNSKYLISIILLVDAIFLLILCINFFYPIVFYIDEFNRYQRLPAFFLYTALGVVFTFVALIIYIISRVKGGVFKSFPVIELVAPIFLGLIIQGRFYGVSLIWPATAVGFTLMVLSIQNRNLLLDSMTGLYNKRYLETFKFKKHKYCLMQISLNGFKAINDTYGKSEGDKVIIGIADVLLTSVGVVGTAIHSSGDEFIILLNTNNEEVAEKYVEDVNHNIADFNNESDKPYKISYALVWKVFDFDNTEIDQVLDELYSQMRKEKSKVTYHI